METDAFLHSGSKVFEGHPSYAHFNRSYNDDPHTDALYQLLNEIDPVHLRNGDEANREFAAVCAQELIDPRTKREVSQTEYNHSDASTNRIFCNTMPSTLTKGQHVMCVRVLRAWQEQESVDESDLITWRSTQRKRDKEQVKMQEFIANYATAHREAMYAPAKRLVALYKHWYAQQATRLLEKQPLNVAYNTYIGLPHVNVCRGDAEEQAANIGNVQLLQRNGFIPLWETLTNADCGRMHCKLEQHFENYMAGEQQIETPDIDEILCHVNEDDNEQEDVSRLPQIILPLESLLFLLTAGDYLDLPTEMPVTIEDEVGDAERKVLRFDLPLPTRNSGWHTDKLVVEHAYAAYIASVEQVRWLHVQDKKVSVMPPRAVDELNAAIGEKPCDYKPQRFDDYLQCREEASLAQEECVVRPMLKENMAVLRWQLSQQPSSEIISIPTTPAAPTPTVSYDMYSTMTLPPAVNETASRFVGTHCIKLEYKPQFGCELMTKYELLREWWRLRLLSGCDVASVDSGHCTRISIANFATQLEEQLSLEQLERRLAEKYHIRMPQLLSNLMEFLRLLLKMQAGKYLLRYNAKYKKKLLLCAPTEEITQNTIFLHGLLQTEPSDMAFMTQPCFLPVDTDLCSRMHLKYKVLPGMFLPNLNKKTAASTSKKGQAKAKPKQFINDRERLLQRVEVQKAKLKSQNNTFSRAKKWARVKKLKKLKKQMQGQLTEAQQLQQEIAEDQKIFGC